MSKTGNPPVKLPVDYVLEGICVGVVQADGSLAEPKYYTPPVKDS
jgi:hypothetical protein